MAGLREVFVQEWNVTVGGLVRPSRVRRRRCLGAVRRPGFRARRHAAARRLLARATGV